MPNSSSYKIYLSERGRKRQRSNHDKKEESGMRGIQWLQNETMEGALGSERSSGHELTMTHADDAQLASGRRNNQE